MKEWLVKVRRYAPDGEPRPESVVGFYDDRVIANIKAADLNTQYQTDTYYVERYDPSKMSGWVLKPTSELTNEELFPQW